MASQVTRTVPAYKYRKVDNARLDAFYASTAWDMIRYEALVRDDGQCQLCGRNRADGVVLQVDHIKPLRLFWHLRLILTNLQTLCRSCNSGKGARHDHDWRSRGPTRSTTQS